MTDVKKKKQLMLNIIYKNQNFSDYSYYIL